MALAVVTAIFFMWGFITCLNDILIPHLKAAFSLTWVQAMLIQFTFFGAYFLMSLPAGRLVAAVGWLADHYGLQASFLLPMLCYLFIVFYAWRGSRRYA